MTRYRPQAMNGRRWRLYTRVDGRWQPFAGAQQESLSISNETVDISDGFVDGFSHVLTGYGQSCQLQLTAVAIVSPAFRRLQRTVADNRSIEIRAVAYDAYIEGWFVPGDYSQQGATDDAVNFSISFSNNGAFLFAVGPDALALIGIADLHDAVCYTLSKLGESCHG